jgi:putative ABC transport system substrate-binding protein
MKRRAFIAMLGGAAFEWALPAHAQQAGRVFRVGWLGVTDVSDTAVSYRQFLEALRANGFIEGENLVVETRALDDPRGPLAAGADLTRAQPDVIVAQGPEIALQAVIGASQSIPIVLQAVNYDPIARGYVTSLARPGGNITGLFYRQPELAAKKVELLAQAFPDRSRLAVLWDALVEDEFRGAERAAKSLVLELYALKLENPPYDFDAAFRNLAKSGAEMLLVLSSPFFSRYRRQLAELALAYRLPSMFLFKSYVDAGGLMAYGVDNAAMYRRTGDFVAKILKGAKPADLPIEQATKFELIINLKTAKALGIDIPPVFLARADEVIE